MNKLGMIALVGLMTMFSCNRSDPSHGENDSTSLADFQVIRSVDSRNAKALLDEEKDILLLDVRTPEEFAEGHLVGAKNLDFNGSNFMQQLQQLDPNRKYMLYCAVGGRSGKSLKIMEEMGFKEVYNVSEGFKDLREQGIPVSPSNE
jgi:rhodanese-related sulfurtransferase